MIEDELLEIQIAKADHNERMELLRQKAELKKKRIQEYKQKLKDEAMKQDHVEDKKVDKGKLRLMSINFSQKVKKKSKSPPRFKVEEV